MDMVLEWLAGKKSYALGFSLVIVAGLYNQGYITQTTFDALVALLGGSAVMALRAAISKAVSGGLWGLSVRALHGQGLDQDAGDLRRGRHGRLPATGPGILFWEDSDGSAAIRHDASDTRQTLCAGDGEVR